MKSLDLLKNFTPLLVISDTVEIRVIQSGMVEAECFCSGCLLPECFWTEVSVLSSPVLQCSLWAGGDSDGLVRSLRAGIMKVPGALLLLASLLVCGDCSGV